MPNQFSFDFGPISRTLGPSKDKVGFASLALHEVTTALLGARNRNEFLAWLIHDTFKALFDFRLNNNGRPVWQHIYIPNVNNTHYLKPVIDTFASKLWIPPEYINEHHKKGAASSAFKMLSESVTVTSEFDQVYLGEEAHFLQLSFKCQPAASTLLLRLAILEAFLHATSKVVARIIKGFDLGFTDIKYIFKPEANSIAQKDIAALYKLDIKDSILSITHLVPSNVFKEISVQIDLTDRPQNRNNSHEIGLSELLTVYRDDLTIIVSLPLFITDPDCAVKEINSLMRVEAHEVFNRMGIAIKHRNAIVPDLLNAVIDEQVELRPVYSPYVSNEGHIGRNITGKAIYRLVGRPYELLADSSLLSRCLVCGSSIMGGRGRYFDSGKKVIEDIFSSHFSDFEHLSFSDDICPMCLIYANSENKKLMRGSLAIFAPATSLGAPVGHRLIETKSLRFDQAGRFDLKKPMLKSVMTLQELILLTMMSRRILASLIPFDTDQARNELGNIIMPKKAGDELRNASIGKYLPYSGSYCLFDIAAINKLYSAIFLGIEREKMINYDIWQEAHLIAYPFEILLSPSFTMLLELRRNAKFQSHAQAHTLLKVKPTIVHLSSNLTLSVLVDNSVQEIIDKNYIEIAKLISKLASSVLGINQYEFAEALLSGDDPITAAYDATARPKGRLRTDSDWFIQKIQIAEKMSKLNNLMEDKSPEDMWNTFMKERQRIRAMCEAHPTLIHFLQKNKTKGG